MSDKARVALLILLVEIKIPASQSLKDKRQVVHSLKERLRNRFNISVAEVGALEKWQRSVVGISKVSNDSQHLDSCANKLVEFIQTEHRVEVISTKMEIL